jgi:putative intracellular protease/amidase
LAWFGSTAFRNVRAESTHASLDYQPGGIEYGELSKPWNQLRAKRVEVSIAAPQNGLITGKRGYKMGAELALDAMCPEEFGLLILLAGKAPGNPRKNPKAVAIPQHSLQPDKAVAAIRLAL